MIPVPAPHPAGLDQDALLRQCESSLGRSSGPGGQHRNKVETKVTIRHHPTALEAHASERRSQLENRTQAVFRLRLALATHARAPVPPGEIRTPLWLSRVDRAGRIACNPAHEDFPALLALAMDVLAAARWDPRKASLRLGCTASQLLRLVQAHPPAFVALNEARHAEGLRRLHP